MARAATGMSTLDDYSSQVVAYLDPDQRQVFADRPAWDAMQDAVVSRLQALLVKA